MPLDYVISEHLTAWTAATPLHRGVAYVLAELLLLAYPLVLYVLWQQPESRGHFHVARKAVMMALMSVVIGLAIISGLGLIWSRPRPFVTHPQLPHMLFNLDPPSFPSAHALMAMAIGVSLYYSGYRRLGWVLMAGALLIALGQTLAGVHYASDVAGGLMTGTAVAWYMHREASGIRKYLPNR